MRDKNALHKIADWWSARPKVENRSWFREWLPTKGNTLFTVLFITLLFAAQGAGAFPNLAPASPSTSTISYQGRLADSNGDPLTQIVNMEFRVYDVPSGGTPLWEELWTGGNAIQVSDGLFNVMLGSISTNLASVVQNQDELHLGITVGTDNEMSPRVQLGSVPFSMQALTVPDASISKEKLAFTTTTLLGIDSCFNCGSPKEVGLSSWNPVKGEDANDNIEVTVTTSGRPITVNMVSRAGTSKAVKHFCGFRILQGTISKQFVHVEGSYAEVTNLACSGSVTVDLPEGTYTFRAEQWFNPSADVTWQFDRQIVVFEN